MTHPEFPRRITAKIWDSVYRRLNIPKYQQYFTGGLEKSEIEDLFLLDTFTPPALGVTLGPIDHEPQASQRANQTTVIDLILVWRPPRRTRETDDELRARVIDDLRVTLSADFGQLRDENGDLLTEALTRFQRLNPALAVPRGNPQYLIDRFRVAYQSYVGPDFQFEG